MRQELIIKNFTTAGDIINNFISNRKNVEKIEFVAEEISKRIIQGSKVISCGNGGSMADAMHFAEELSGRFRNDRPALPAISISDPTHITCTANDYGFDFIFSRFVEAIGQKGDVLLLISTSGNSDNIINAALEAKNKEIYTVALTGNDGGKLKELCDTEIRVDYKGYSDRIQEMHIKILHTLVELIEINTKNRK